MAVREDRATMLAWNARPFSGRGLALVVTAALEMPGPRHKHLRAFCEETGLQVAEVDVICADPYQVIFLPLDDGALPVSGSLTLRLQLDTGGGHLWLFAPDAGATGGLEYHVPHLAVSSGAPGNHLERLCSMASLQTFSWKEGCVLDGLLALDKTGSCPSAGQTIRDHLRYFGFDSGDLVYESPESRRIVNQLTSIETTLPFAIIAAIEPGHLWVQLALDFWQSQMDTHGQVHEGHLISSEGAYTVAYPMTAIAVLRGEDRWLGIAENLLTETCRHLIRPEGIYLRHWSDGRFTHRNWARGLAWLLLGHAQTLLHHPNPPEPIRQQLETIAAFAARHQLDNGLWACFVDEPEAVPDCAGSAGIAAGLLLASNAGLLPSEYLDHARKSRATLLKHLTPEGFLSGCSQSNKGGEELQRSPYRVITPYALGLLGLLETFTRSPAGNETTSWLKEVR